MNYYIIPKNNFNITISLLIKTEKVSPFISYSLIYHLNDIYTQLLNIEFDEIETTQIQIPTLEYINKIVNPFEFIHTNVPGYFLSVSKVKPSSNIFFELMEIFQVCNIIELLSSKTHFHIAHITKNNSSTNYLIEMLRENNTDTIINEEFDFDKLCETFVSNSVYKIKMDLFLFEFSETDYINTHKYINNMILVLYIASKYQAENGICIIKIDNLFYKTIVDILFIFSAIYDKVIIIKPSISKVTKGERYLICKNFNTNILANSRLLQQLDVHIKSKIENNMLKHNIIHSLIKNDIPYFFLNKIEEVNAVIGQQQLEAYDQILNILKNKNRNDKIELLKKNHIQKCIQWCEKNQLPHNKFTEKMNIFINSQQMETLAYDNNNNDNIVEDNKTLEDNIKYDDKDNSKYNDNNDNDIVYNILYNIVDSIVDNNKDTTLFNNLLNEIEEINEICNANIEIIESAESLL